MNKGVLKQGFIEVENWMQSNCNTAGVESKSSSSNQFIRPFIKSSHTKSVIGWLKPLEVNSVLNPW